MSQPVLIPGPDHPITVTPSSEHVVVRRDGQTLADTTNALVLQEANYPPVHYIPMSDVERGALADSDTTSYCPYKGTASYFSAPGEADVAWYYPAAHDAVAEITDHVAFYPNKVELSVES
jgi:uncharacterized protein (DUF427 family)